jgi:hypothetical protein
MKTGESAEAVVDLPTHRFTGFHLKVLKQPLDKAVHLQGKTLGMSQLARPQRITNLTLADNVPQVGGNHEAKMVQRRRSKQMA